MPALRTRTHLSCVPGFLSAALCCFSCFEQFVFATIAHIYVITHIRMHHEVTMHTPRYAEDTLIPNSEMPANSLSIQWV